MDIRWLGHACFLLQSKDGIRVLTDPFDETVGYPPPIREVDVVTVSHQHFDHNAVGLLPGNPSVVEGPGEHYHKGISFEGISTYHDGLKGALRGSNTVFVFEMDGVRVCHMGDLGHLLTAKQMESLGRIDLLLIPVGGTFTIDADQARETVERLKPRVTVPMHYKTRYLDFPITGVDVFTRHFRNVKTATSLTLDRESLPDEPMIIVLEPAVERDGEERGG